MNAEPDRTPIAHSARYVARGLPDLPYQYGRGVLRPAEITLTYRAAPDSQLGRVHAYVAGRLWVDGAEIPHAPYGQHYDSGLGSWPEWLAEEAQLHDPEVVPAVSSPAPADQYPARDRLFALIASIPGSGTANWCDHARAHLDDYRAEVLAERAVSSSAPADRAAELAKHVARAIWALKSPAPAGSEHYRSGWDDGLEAAINAARAAVLREDLAGPDGADAVDRGAVLRELADRADPANEASWFGDFGHLVGEWIRKQADYEERRLAGEARDEREAPHPETAFTPRRGDSVEAWLRDWRDQFGHKGPTWVELDNVLDDYRLHADTGTPLGEHVCEGRAVGDCDCLELPEAAEGAQQ